jgi:hypothetical protein
VYEKRVLRRISGPKGEEMGGHWRRLHNEKLHNLYDSPNIVKSGQIKEDEMGGAYSTYGRDKKSIQNVRRKT